MQGVDDHDPLRSTTARVIAEANCLNRPDSGISSDDVSNTESENLILRVYTATIATIAALGLAGCAQSPESIQPNYVSAAQYTDWSCPQLAEESAHLQAALSQASQQQDDARTGDTLGVIFLGLPVSSMSGSNVAPEVARLKGTINAVHEAQTRHNCGA